MDYVNLTPHAVVVMPEAGEHTAIATSGTVARIDEIATGSRNGHVVIALLGIIGLPDPVDGVTYIASMPLLMALVARGIERPDVVYPYGQVRDSAGRIIGCRQLAALVVA